MRIFFLAFVTAFLLMLPPSGAGAQEFDLFEDEACKEDPNSEECICAKVRAVAYYPLKYTRDPGVDGEYSGEIFAESVGGDPDDKPVFNEDTGAWEGEIADPSTLRYNDDGNVVSADGDLILTPNDNYNQQCSLSYVRENLRRLWRFGVALGAALAAASIAWAGVVWMQETSSGNDIARSRGMIVRVLIGVIILSCSYLVWEGLSGLLVGHIESWTGERGTFYRPW